MTCYVVVFLCKKFGINTTKEKVVVSKQASQQGGTSANLYEGDELNVWDALHGLMLPSGIFLPYKLAIILFIFVDFNNIYFL